MELFYTRPGCSHPLNCFSELDDPSHLKTVQQKYCFSCGMPLILACDRYIPTMRPCVVKQFQPAAALSPKSLDVAQTLFEREAVALEKLDSHHEQIPQLYAFFPLFLV